MQYDALTFTKSQSLPRRGCRVPTSVEHRQERGGKGREGEGEREERNEKERERKQAAAEGVTTGEGYRASRRSLPHPAKRLLPLNRQNVYLTTTTTP